MRWRIHYFIVTSLLVHAALLSAWTSMPTQHFTLPASPSSAPGLSVVLQQTNKPEQQAKPQRHQASHKLLARKQEGHQPPREADNKPIATSQLQRDVASAAAAELQQVQIRDRVLSRIRNHLNQYFVYPLLARREGWQGRVLLGFSVEADGAIRNIHVAAGSGYSILDNSAVSALSQINSLTEVGSWLRGQRLDLQMPVIFRLQGG